MALGQPPQPTAPWRVYIFRVHCIVTQRWMKIRVPFAWFWYGDDEFGNPEVESGTIAASNPQPPAHLAPRLPVGTPLANDVGQLTEQELEPYRTPTHAERAAAEEAARPESLEERLDRMEQELRQARSASDPRNFGDDSGRGGR